MKKLFFLVLLLALPALAAVNTGVIPFQVTADGNSGVRVQGDPTKNYAVEYSNDLQNWQTIALVKGDGKILVPNPNPKRTGYFRARLNNTSSCSEILTIWGNTLDS